jgi:hypothetical protein
LRALASGKHVSLTALVSKLAEQLSSDHTDDTAIVGIQWLN